MGANAIVAGRYLAIRELGKGAFGTVFAAHDSELHRQVALKFIRSGLEGDRANEWRARLMREAKAMARVSHQNVVTLYDVGVSDDDGVFLAMELIEGGTLGYWLRSAQRNWREIVAHLCAAGDGLAAAHRAGIIHRDFKLENVLLGSDGRPRVTDFGIARSAETTGGEATASTTGGVFPLGAGDVATTAPLPPLPAAEALAKLTLTGAVMGTPGYMAPEQYRNDVEIDARADVFAFCATLYRALYGERAFAGETFEEIALATFEGKVRKPPKRTSVPTWVHRVVVAGLSPDRNARPNSIDAVLTVLRSDSGRTRRRWAFAATAGLATVFLVGLAARAFGTHVHAPRDQGAITRDPSPPGHDVAKDAPAPAEVAASATAVGVTENATAVESSATAAEGQAGPRTQSARPPPRSAPLSAPQAAASHAKTRATTPAIGGVRAAHGGTGPCTVEVNYDAEGAPHFKRVCN